MRPFRTLLLSGVALAAASGAAWADESAWGDDVEVLADGEMADYRGGFEIAGIEVNFGAVVTTFVNGVPAMTTNLTVTDVGSFIEQTVGDIGQNIADMTPEQLDALGLSELEGANGVVLSDASGVTALVHNLTAGSLQNIIVNTASGRDLSQQVDVTVELPGFDLLQQELFMEDFGFQLMRDMEGVQFGGPGG